MGGTIAENGCVITSLAIISSGYNMHMNPEYFRKKYSPNLEGEKIPIELRNLDIYCTDFYYSNVLFIESY